MLLIIYLNFEARIFRIFNIEYKIK
jgi:hypothetical protein